MTNFKIGDYVYGDDWCYGRIVDIDPEGYAHVEFETFNGGGCMWFEIDELTLAKSPIIYSHDEDKNRIITELMYDWECLVAKAKCCGMDIRLAPNCSNTLELYFHEDYPNMLLVDKGE